MQAERHRNPGKVLWRYYDSYDFAKKSWVIEELEYTFSSYVECDTCYFFQSTSDPYTYKCIGRNDIIRIEDYA